MQKSKTIGSYLGPVIMAMILSEFPLVQPHLYDAQIPPLVYLSGVLMFFGGLVVVRNHNHWKRDWTVLISISGWFFLALGLIRMFLASQYRSASAGASPIFFMAIEAILFGIGLVITVKSYWKSAA